MPWQVEQNTGVNDYAERCVWFKGYIYAFTQDAGVWRRDGVGPWTQVFVNGNTGGRGWVWEDDEAIYCGGGNLAGNEIWRSVDGTNWTLDVDLNVAFGLQGLYHDYSEIGGYGDYLYVANHDVGGPGTTFFYRRDLDGNWAAFGAPHVGVEGAGGRGIVGFGGEVYWTNSTNARYWDGAAWSVEATLDAQSGTWLSVLDDILYVRTSTSQSLIGGYYWKTTTSTEWAFMNLPVPDNTWGGWTLCQGEDGEIYTVAQDGTTLRIYQKVGPLLNLLHYQATVAVGLGTRGGVCVDATGEMFFGTRVAGTVQFFRFVGDYDVAPGGLYPQAVDCDGDGDALYVALYDTATTFPLLVSVALPLVGGVSVGSNIFPAAAGSAINVKCTDIGDQVVVSGNFGNNEQVETTDDAGLNWTDIDRDAWGGDVAEPLLVSPVSIEEVLVALATGVITETFDSGATAWLINNAAVGYSPGAMARLPGGDELVVGDDGAVRIDYSPNRGETLVSITGVVYAGNVAALEVA
jgi:hypothetical protein